MLNKTERTGRVDQAKGHIKQVVGVLTGNDDLEAEGKVDETVGKVEEIVGRVGRKAGEAVVAANKANKAEKH